MVFSLPARGYLVEIAEKRALSSMEIGSFPPCRDLHIVSRARPKIYYLHPLALGPLEQWSQPVGRCREMGFNCVAIAPVFAPGRAGNVFLTGDFERAHPVFRSDLGADEVVAEIANKCRQNGLELIVDVVIGRVDAGGALASSHSALFAAPPSGVDRVVDPRSEEYEAASARFDSEEPAEELVTLWAKRLGRLLDAGATGFRFLEPHHVPSNRWRQLLVGMKERSPGFLAFAWTPGLSWPRIEALAGAGFDGVFSSAAWWDFRAGWFVEEYEILRRVAPVLGCPEPPFGRRLAARPGMGPNLTNTYRQSLRFAAAAFDGVLVPMGFERATRVPMDARGALLDEGNRSGDVDLVEDVRAANHLVEQLSAMAPRGEIRNLTGPDEATTALLRLDGRDARLARGGLAILVNPDLKRTNSVDIALDPLPPAAGACLGKPSMIGGLDPFAPLAPGEVRLVEVKRPVAVRDRVRGERQTLRAAMEAPRIIVDRIAPAVDGGRFALKRLIGETVGVEADIFSDGHGVIAADLLWKAADEKEWRRIAMRIDDNDRWSAAFRPMRIGRHLFTIDAWADEYATLCRGIDVKSKAAVDHQLDLEEAYLLVEEALAQASGLAKDALADALGKTTSVKPERDRLLAEETRDAIRATSSRRFLVRHEPALPVEVERPQAGVGAWYEMFPRSASGQERRHGTLLDVIRHLPAVRAMGFDVLYFPPIHPVGTTHRKGRNNSLEAASDDPGSSYAIGSPQGGHDAIHPALGTFEDFARLRDAAATHGLEIALDFAIQCSPDHPWLKQHADWFRWRPDGSIEYAENPPKKYEDIVNVEFYAEPPVPDLWLALRDIVLFWVAHGINIFRVDNPHTKPLPFWEWLISEVRGRHPEVIFLAEAFTRPKIMHRLAKIGFSQSYTYFTWRNTKQELTEYLTELSSPPVADYFRPHFFVNTPDINPYYLQRSGHPGFLVRAALAATLSGLWGMYSGFELCEAAAPPGREEYLDSEKYEIKVRDFDRPGNIVAEITKLNRIRKTYPALQRTTGLSFFNAYNDQVLVYSKSLPNPSDMIVVAVSLDPFQAQEVTFELPLWQLGVPDHGTVTVEDLMRDHQFVWTGTLQRIRLDPAEMPFAIWRIAPLQNRKP
jgi:starch synthase (maltosyl-transferring)